MPRLRRLGLSRPGIVRKLAYGGTCRPLGTTRDEGDERGTGCGVAVDAAQSRASRMFRISLQLEHRSWSKLPGHVMVVPYSAAATIVSRTIATDR